MKRYRVMGSIFIIVLIILSGFAIWKGLGNQLFFSSGKTVTITDQGNLVPNTIDVNLGNGELSIVKNTSVSGWYVIIKYNERDKPPKISSVNGTLSIELGNGIIYLHVGDLNEVKFYIGNGIMNVLSFNSTCNVHGSLVNGDVNIRLYNGNISLGITVTNGEVDISASDAIVTGFAKVINGQIRFNLSTNYGGEIRFNVDNGYVDIALANFDFEKNVSGSSVTGKVYREGDAIDLELRVVNGGIDLIVIGL